MFLHPVCSFQQSSFQKVPLIFNRSIFLTALSLYLLIYDLKSLFPSGSCSFHIFLVGTSTNFILVSCILCVKTHTNGLCFVILSSLDKPSNLSKTYRGFFLLNNILPDCNDYNFLCPNFLRRLIRVSKKSSFWLSSKPDCGGIN